MHLYLAAALLVLLPAGLLLSGFTLLVAYLSEMNPQITPLMPVLLSPWLSLHVSLIMVSYALFALMCLCSILALSIRRHAWQRQRLTLFVGSCFIRQCCAWESEFYRCGMGQRVLGKLLGLGPERSLGSDYFHALWNGFSCAKYPSFQKSVLFHWF